MEIIHQSFPHTSIIHNFVTLFAVGFLKLIHPAIKSCDIKCRNKSSIKTERFSGEYGIIFWKIANCFIPQVFLCLTKLLEMINWICLSFPDANMHLFTWLFLLNDLHYANVWHTNTWKWSFQWVISMSKFYILFYHNC